MSHIKIYLQGEACAEPEVVEIEESATIKEIAIIHQKKINPDGSFDETFKVFLEDDDNCKENSHHHKDAGICDKSSIHCHRCQKVDLTLTYNNQHKSIPVAPGYTGDKIVSLVPALFGITPNDAADLRLCIDGSHYLGEDDHIGSLVQYPQCAITLTLESKKRVIG